MKKLVIITGTSRGLGLHLAELFLQAGFTVIGIARNNSLKNPHFHFLKTDLGKSIDLSQKLSRFLKQRKITLKNEQVILVNNAATVLPINFIHKLKDKDIHASYLLNLHAPMLLAKFTLEKFLNKTEQITICNISSGAAIRPLMNWSVYCSLKSGLKMFTECIQLEYADCKKVKSFSFYPGVMNTKMQSTIRKQKSGNFKNLEYFKELKTKNNLLNPKQVAQSLFKVLENHSGIDKTEYNIKDL